MSITAPGERSPRETLNEQPRLHIDLRDPPRGLQRRRGSAGFTPRQAEILTFVAQGLGNAEIAARLGISRRTVEKHIECIHMKAGTSTRARLVAYATSSQSAPASRT